MTDNTIRDQLRDATDIALAGLFANWDITTGLPGPSVVAVHLGDALAAAGWRPPVRVIETATELDALPGRSIVIAQNEPYPEAWQLTSHDLYPGSGANWGSPWVDERLSSNQLIWRFGTVAVLWEPKEKQ
ncbi:hypothetical protein [Nocardia otitidiscaviarum]|uniref:hypothetical protein n=1 Tax=Nocardia otitidiscaviarum TaxID=1823 RepID=UPI0004A702B3|nr:hypothetical protein [Nocardia otitidiscaviarum]